MPELSEQLGAILRGGRYTSRFARVAGYAVSQVERSLSSGGLDGEAHYNRTFTRTVAAETAMRLADSLAADAEALRDWAADALEVDARLPVDAVEDALHRGVRRFDATREHPDWLLLVTDSARPDCPAGHVQLTRIDADGPVGHTYADASDGWRAVAREVVAQGYRHG
jgi:hypothetical protein